VNVKTQFAQLWRLIDRDGDLAGPGECPECHDGELLPIALVEWPKNEEEVKRQIVRCPRCHRSAGDFGRIAVVVFRRARPREDPCAG
jgi:hypothetical protein